MCEQQGAFPTTGVLTQPPELSHYPGEDGGRSSEPNMDELTLS